MVVAVGPSRTSLAVVAVIEVRRAKDVAGRFRRVTILLDGARVAGLRPGENASVTVPAGIHNLQARMDWVKSPTIAVDDTVDAGAIFEFSLHFSFNGLRSDGMHAHRV